MPHYGFGNARSMSPSRRRLQAGQEDRALIRSVGALERPWFARCMTEASERSRQRAPIATERTMADARGSSMIALFCGGRPPDRPSGADYVDAMSDQPSTNAAVEFMKAFIREGNELIVGGGGIAHAMHRCSFARHPGHSHESDRR